VDYLVGAEGLTAKASGFGRRDVLAAIGGLLIADSPDGQAAADRIDRIAKAFFTDHRVLRLLDPVRKTSGEVIRPRDEHGRVMREVCLEEEPRFTTTSLLAAETELITRAKRRQGVGAAVVPDEVVARVIDEYNAANLGRELDGDQEAMIWQLCTSGNGVDVVVGKAGTGKSTALAVARQALQAAGIPVIGVAPTANAARQLEQAAGITSGTLDKLLVEVEHEVRHLPCGAFVVLDEAGMTPTRNRLALQQLVDAVGGKVADVGDHRQIPSVDAGGGHAVLARELGAVTLGIDHRFKIPQLRDAAELIRNGHAATGIAVLEELGMVHEFWQPDQRTDALIDTWLDLREQDEHNDVRMLATENAVVERLNLAARAALIHQGEVSRRGKTYVSGDDTRDIRLAVGDRVRLGRNDGHLAQPDGSRVQVRNGMEGTITTVSRRHITVQLDAGEDLTHVTLPAAYVGECVDYAYAVTANKAQGMTVDHVLFAPSPASSQETAYTALSRGRYSNHIFAVIGSGWEEALGVSKAHSFATDQQPTLNDNRCLAEPSRQPDAEWGSDVRLRLLAAHQASRAASPTATSATPSWDAERDRARRQRQQREQPDRQPGQDHRRERGRQRGRDEDLHISM
jgi:ATP-dependent exoDNAse (exonuclease V) alpha subunit